MIRRKENETEKGTKYVRVSNNISTQITCLWHQEYIIYRERRVSH